MEWCVAKGRVGGLCALTITSQRARCRDPRLTTDYRVPCTAASSAAMPFPASCVFIVIPATAFSPTRPAWGRERTLQGRANATLAAGAQLLLLVRGAGDRAGDHVEDDAVDRVHPGQTVREPNQHQMQRDEQGEREKHAGV
jgi:hypothetical protein